MSRKRDGKSTAVQGVQQQTKGWLGRSEKRWRPGLRSKENVKKRMTALSDIAKHANSVSLGKVGRYGSDGNITTRHERMLTPKSCAEIALGHWRNGRMSKQPLEGKKGKDGEAMAQMQQCMMTKGFVCKVQLRFIKAMVYTTGDPKYYLFAALDPSGLYETGLQWPVRKADLKRGALKKHACL